MNDDRLRPEELDAWPAPEPPAGFSDRVLSARDAVPAAAPPRSSRRLATVAAGVAVAAAVALVWPGAAADTGALAATERRTVALGERGLAVAEAGAALSWHVEPGGDAVVEQTSGDVFYRVDPGGRFAVDTPAGRVEVTGTCFRIRLQETSVNKSIKSGLAGAAVGALIAVTVYEGRVIFADSAGTTEVRAGETLSASGGGRQIGDSAEVEPAVASIGEAPPADDISRDELLARDAIQRQEIASLRTKLRAAEAQAGGRGGGGGEVGPDGRPWFDPGEETLRAYADNCEVRFDLPISGPGDAEWNPSPEALEEAGLDADEAAAIERAVEPVLEAFRGELRALYVEATGDTANADMLSINALVSEIGNKSEPGEVARIRALLAQERAGLRPAPADLSGTSPAERLYRLLARIGDEAQAAVATVIGDERAYELRALGGGWPSKWTMGGCAEDEP